MRMRKRETWNGEVLKCEVVARREKISSEFSARRSKITSRSHKSDKNLCSAVDGSVAAHSTRSSLALRIELGPYPGSRPDSVK